MKLREYLPDTCYPRSPRLLLVIPVPTDLGDPVRTRHVPPTESACS